MSHTLIFGADEALARWACERIPHLPYSPTMRAVGVNEGPDMGDKLLAVCVYHGYLAPLSVKDESWYGLCEISFAAASPKWATRRTINNLLSIPFLQYNCRKIVTVIPSRNTRAIEFNKGIGLKLEGTLRHHFAKNVHACVFGMMKSEYEARWRNPQAARLRHQPDRRPHGQVHTVSASAIG
jgi:RimJ/RimL family protein N-acetyltransferase